MSRPASEGPEKESGFWSQDWARSKESAPEDSGRDQRLESPQQLRQIQRTLVAHVVDEERRRALDGICHPTRHVLSYALGIDTRGQFVVEPDDVEAERSRVVAEVPIGERALTLEEQIVHLPETSLRCGGLRRLGSSL